MQQRSPNSRCSNEKWNETVKYFCFLNCPSVVAWRRCNGIEFHRFRAVAEYARRPAQETVQCSAKRFSEEEHRERGGKYGCHNVRCMMVTAEQGIWRHVDKVWSQFCLRWAHNKRQLLFFLVRPLPPIEQHTRLRSIPNQASFLAQAFRWRHSFLKPLVDWLYSRILCVKKTLVSKRFGMPWNLTRMYCLGVIERPL